MAETKSLYESLGNIQALNLKAKADTQAYNYKYATLEQIWGLLIKPLKEQSLVVQQTPQRDVLRTTVTSTASGESISSETPLLTPDTSSNHMQDLGSAITYARRYSLACIFNIVTDDDDNQSANTDTPTAPRASATKPASDKQKDLARDLLNRKIEDGMKQAYIQGVLKKEVPESSADFSKLIDALMKEPNKATGDGEPYA